MKKSDCESHMKDSSSETENKERSPMCMEDESTENNIRRIEGENGKLFCTWIDGESEPVLTGARGVKITWSNLFHQIWKSDSSNHRRSGRPR